MDSLSSLELTLLLLQQYRGDGGRGSVRVLCKDGNYIQEERKMDGLSLKMPGWWRGLHNMRVEEVEEVKEFLIFNNALKELCSKIIAPQIV